MPYAPTDQGVTDTQCTVISCRTLQGRMPYAPTKSMGSAETNTGICLR